MPWSRRDRCQRTSEVFLHACTSAGASRGAVRALADRRDPSGVEGAPATGPLGAVTMAGVGKSTGAFGGPRVTALVCVTFALAALVSSVARAPPAGSLAGASCLGLGLREGVWTRDASACVSGAAPAAGCDDPETGAFWFLDAASVQRCGALPQTRSNNAFRGRRVFVVGDSIARHVYASVLALAAVDPEAHQLSSQEKHKNWTHPLVDGGVASFVWAPFVSNVTRALDDVFDRDAEKIERTPSSSTFRTSSSIVILSATLWDALHVRSVDAYVSDLNALKEKLVARSSTRLRRQDEDAEKRETDSAPFVFWLAAPRVFDDALTDPAKRTYMTDEKVRLYGEAARRVPGFLYRDDTTAATFTATNEKKRGESDTDSEKAFAAVPVDVGALAAGCAAAVAGDARCSSDGVHASRAVYDAAAQVIANVVVAHAVAR
jgi:hypothetical protein